MPRFLFCFAALAFALGVVIDAEAAITVDGDLTDWGVTQNGTNILTYTGASYDATVVYTVVDPYSALGRGTWTNFWGESTLHYLAEDTVSDKVGPDYGGQNYDTEYLGALIHGGMLYIGIATGQRPDNGVTLYAPGDIRLAIGGALGPDSFTSLYGVEVGGGAGGSLPASKEIVGGADGTTYTLDSHGYTTGSTPAASAQVAGSIWETPESEWYMDPIAPSLPTQLNQTTNSVLAGAADQYCYTFPDYDGSPSQHAFIELSIDLDDIGLDPILSPTTINVAWRPSCGNDDSWTDVDVIMPPPPVPEPASIAVWGLLILSIGGCARWRRHGKNASP